MDGCVGGWVGQWGCVGQWVGSDQISKILINLDLIEIIQFCLKNYDLWRHPSMDGCVGGWVGQWGCVGQWMGSDQISKILINLDLIEIIQFCLKIYDL